jgi:uncharacterized protein (DUF2267 family)
MIARSIQSSQGMDEMEDYGYNNGRHNKNYGRQRESGRMKAMNFERYAEEGNHFINQVADELNTDSRSQAARITRAVLHAVRDRFRPDDAVNFGQGLPLALKAVYFDQYDISKTPVRIRNQRDFLNFIRSKDSQAEANDFPGQDHVVFAMQAVFNVLESHLGSQQINKLKYMLPQMLVALLEY